MARNASKSVVKRDLATQDFTAIVQHRVEFLLRRPMARWSKGTQKTVRDLVHLCVRGDGNCESIFTSLALNGQSDVITTFCMHFSNGYAEALAHKRADEEHLPVFWERWFRAINPELVPDEGAIIA